MNLRHAINGTYPLDPEVMPRNYLLVPETPPPMSSNSMFTVLTPATDAASSRASRKSSFDQTNPPRRTTPRSTATSICRAYIFGSAPRTSSTYPTREPSAARSAAVLRGAVEHPITPYATTRAITAGNTPLALRVTTHDFL